MNKLILVKKTTMETITIDGVLQLDLCNMADIDGDISDSGWNFISIITRNKDNKIVKQVIKLEDIMQFSLVKQRGDKE